MRGFNFILRNFTETNKTTQIVEVSMFTMLVVVMTVIENNMTLLDQRNKDVILMMPSWTYRQHFSCDSNS